MRLYVALGVVVSVLVAFAPAFDNGFWRDDFIVLECAETARLEPHTIWRRWLEPFNRPLAQMALLGEYRLFGLRPGAYVVTNAILHALNAVLLFHLIRALLGSAVGAGAALLFALGFGFYGKAVFWAANLPEMLATGFLLGACIAAERLARIAPAQRRPVDLAIVPLLFALALACKETGITGLVVIPCLLWLRGAGRRHTLLILALLAALTAIYLAIQLATQSGITRVATDGKRWLILPLRALRLAAFMITPLQESAILDAAPSAMGRLAAVLAQVRTVLGLLVAAVLGVLLVRGSAAVRWLCVTLAVFLLPYGFIDLPGSWIDIRYAYLPATCVCALAAAGFVALWARGGRIARVALATLAAVVIAADLVVVRRLESQWHVMSHSTESAGRMRILLEHCPTIEPPKPSSRAN